MKTKEFRIDPNWDIGALRTLRNEKIQDADKSIENEELDDAKEIMKQIEALDERISELEEIFNNKEIEGGRSMDKVLRPQINNYENGGRRMNPAFVAAPINQPHEVRAFEHYLHTKELREDIKTDTGAVVVPHDYQTKINEIADKITTLSDFVAIENVEFGSGTIPVLKQDIPALPKVAELEENPQLALAPYNTVKYEIDTHRGFIRISKEVEEDNRSDLTNLILNYFTRSRIATENKVILDELNKLKEVKAVGIDGIKTALNTKLLPNYANNVIIMNSTTFNELDKLKDANGRYMLQDRVGDAPGKAINGVPVHVLSDKELPGNKMVIGSLKDAVMLFRRSEYTLQWMDYMHFGQGFMTAIRRDCQLMNKEAAYLLDFSMTDKKDTP